MEITRFYVGLGFVVVPLVLVIAQEVNRNPIKCATPNSLEGKCIHISQCPSVLKIKQTNPLTTDLMTYWRRSQCNYDDDESTVCCPVSNKTQPFQLPTDHKNRTKTVLNRFKPDPGLPGLEVCGRQMFDNKIFGGEVTGIDEFPWMALLEYKMKNPIYGHGFACGGALITNRHVLTAAHCVSGQNEQALGGLINVRLGEHNIEKEKDCDAIYPDDCANPPVDFDIEQKFVHESYDEDSIHQLNDIAVLKLAKIVEYNDFIKPICLSTKLPEEVHQPGHLQFVAGWGQTEFQRNSPVKLKLKIPLVGKKECAGKYKQFGVQLGDKQLCAGGEKDKDSCSGDSGGPLMVQAVSNKTGVIWYMTGIVSIGPTPCANNGVPGIYTKVQNYMDWVLEKIKL